MIALLFLLLLSSAGMLAWMWLKPAQWRAFVARDNERLRAKGLNEKLVRWLERLESGLLMQFALIVVFLLASLSLLARTGILGRRLG
jgi:hypothetical protein